MAGNHMDSSVGPNSITVSSVPPVLQLRASNEQENRTSNDETKTKSKVRWHEKVVDNEHMNKKKTKICCIFHPNVNIDDEEDVEKVHNHGHNHEDDPTTTTSSSSSSSSSSDEDEGKDFDARRKSRLERRRKKLQKQTTPSPNAYEIQPDYSEYREKYLRRNL